MDVLFGFPTPFVFKRIRRWTNPKKKHIHLKTTAWFLGTIGNYRNISVQPSIQIPGLPGVATLDKPPMCAWRRKRWIWNQMIRRWTRTLDEHFEGFKESPGKTVFFFFFFFLRCVYVYVNTYIYMNIYIWHICKYIYINIYICIWHIRKYVCITIYII